MNAEELGFVSVLRVAGLSPSQRQLPSGSRFSPDECPRDSSGSIAPLNGRFESTQKMVLAASGHSRDAI